MRYHRDRLRGALLGADPATFAVVEVDPRRASRGDDPLRAVEPAKVAGRSLLDRGDAFRRIDDRGGVPPVSGPPRLADGRFAHGGNVIVFWFHSVPF